MEPMKMGDFEQTGSPRRGHGMPWWPALVALLMLAGVIVWFIWSKSRQPELPVAETPAPAAAESIPEPLTATEETDAWDLPALAESDDFLRDVASRLSSHPEWLSWIATDDLVRRFVAGVDEVARGELPIAQARFLIPKRGFAPLSSQGRFFMDSSSYDRYTRLTAVVSGLDARGIASLYARLRPLFQDAYRDLGYPQGDFDAALAKAIQNVLDTPDLSREAELVPAVQSYKYADPKLEALPSTQKFMLRLGPDNAAVVKRKLREVAAALDQSQVAGDQRESASRSN